MNLAEASTGSTRAGQEVISSAQAADRRVTRDVLAEFERLRRDILRLLTRPLSDARHFRASALLTAVQHEIDAAHRRLVAEASRAVSDGAELGAAYVDQSLSGASLHVLTSPATDLALARASARNTLALLSPPMQTLSKAIAPLVRQVAHGVEDRATAIQRLASKIDAAAGSAAYQAERIIRTEVSRIFSRSTFERMQAIELEHPYVRKGWHSLDDDRVRQGHLEATSTYATGIPLDESFEIISYNDDGQERGRVRLRYPVDPEAEGRWAAAETIFCRCRLTIHYDLEDFKAAARTRLSLALGTSGGQ